MLQSKINSFYTAHVNNLHKPLEKIITNMMNACQYINGESLERHNWGEYPVKLANIPRVINVDNEAELIKILANNNDKSTTELLWGDIQLGKRLHACIIMWISVYILKRPVLYIFRNLRIDQLQLQHDIIGTDAFSFNTKFIKSAFDEFNSSMRECFKDNPEIWKDFKLPELKNIDNVNVLNKLGNKDSIAPTDILCCLMNHTQLDKINTKFNEYILANHELVNITVLVDESDLMAPTASNNKKERAKKNTQDVHYYSTTKCEKFLALIYNKVKYALHITGTAHSLLYNITTRLSENEYIIVKISKVHKMKMSQDYYGLFNNRISFDTSVNEWWRDDDDASQRAQYNILDDYTRNIKKIIEKIVARTSTRYNSLLLSEEKIRAEQFALADNIIEDFPFLFVIVFHGDCLQVNIPRACNAHFIQLSHTYKYNIIHDHKYNNKNSIISRYIVKSGTIKSLYKIIRIMLSQGDVMNRTVITITGIYGNRGYSFTSDDYSDKYSFHLTDQYVVSHSTYNCTDISQRIRLQGKYSDKELADNRECLTLWTTQSMLDVIQNFYIPFIKQIEASIMECTCWEDIKHVIESIVGNNELKIKEYIKYIDVPKKRKNIKVIDYFNKQSQGYKLIMTTNLSEDNIRAWCRATNLPEYHCINEIKSAPYTEFLSTNATKFKCGVPISISRTQCPSSIRLDALRNFIKHIFPKFSNYTCHKWIAEKGKPTDIFRYDRLEYCAQNNEVYNLDNTGRTEPNELTVIFYEDTARANIHIVYTTDELDETSIKLNDGEFKHIDDTVYYTENKPDADMIKTTYPDYYRKTPDGWLELHSKNKMNIVSLNVVVPRAHDNQVQNTTSAPVSTYIDDFIKVCCAPANDPRARFGITCIYDKYYTVWYEKNKSLMQLKPKLNKKSFTLEFNKIYTMLESKGIDVYKRSTLPQNVKTNSIRGYNVMMIAP